MMTNQEAREERQFRVLGEELWLYPIPRQLRETACEELSHADPVGFLCLASNRCGLDLVLGNLNVLRKLGIYEKALLHAFVSPAMNNCKFPLSELRWMFAQADRELLRAAGEPLPGPGPFAVFRGVSGRGRARRIRGLSWTPDLELAKWFATRFCNFLDASRFADPAVFRTMVNETSVLAYVNRSGRNVELLLPVGLFC